MTSRVHNEYVSQRMIHNEMITWGHWYWPIALIVVSSVVGLLFFPAEIYAAFTNMSNTLSDFARYELNLETATGKLTHLHTWAWWLTLTVWSGFVVWITAHVWGMGPP